MIETFLENNQLWTWLDNLKLWEHNVNEIQSPEQYEKLKKNIRLGQHSDLLVMPDGLVVGGNQRLRAYKEMGYKKAPIKVLSFLKNANGFYALINGEPERDPKTGDITFYFKTEMQGMLTFSKSHNFRAGRDNSEKVANLFDSYDVDKTMFNLDNQEQIPLEKYDTEALLTDDVLQDLEPEKPKKPEVIVECSDEAQQKAIYEKFSAAGFSVRKN